ncbi:MAG TPA: hypothetical protein VNM40_00980 [Candidatus Paceibacterota bacterium]|nr:hypothetical protein [Candidatus Paceibacterota bacterium]
MVVIRKTGNAARRAFQAAFWCATLLFGFIVILFSSQHRSSPETSLTLPASDLWIAHADAPGGGGGYGGGGDTGGDDQGDCGDSGCDSGDCCD